ncbi:MAG TPA: hypothetical protein VHA82_15110 [Ramlibacter sp.]|uniref:hypothetical protein n=1 Tax=Ramlibacter sp. TaxID=1917967 RepID=UPI002BE7B8CA|nr:hypothetical protein [Ramlibacter sp.]HVZ45138.1 hypothetical protein [Ramlibacter sp.]
MHALKTGCALAALAAVLAAPAMAQSTVQSSSGATVGSGAGIAVTPGVPANPMISSTSSQANRLNSVASSDTSVLGGPGVTTTTTVAESHWVRVPPNVESRLDFRRWLRLKD